MAGHDTSSHGNVDVWGDNNDHENHGEHLLHRDDRRSFDLHNFFQMGPKSLVEGEVPEEAEIGLTGLRFSY